MSGYPDIQGPDPASDPALQALLDALLARHPGAVEAALLYGSCLRGGDLFDGLVDIYLVVRDYRSTYRSAFLAAANWLLPPNVFYLEVPVAGRLLRSKVTVISTVDFARGCSRRWFESYLWGRFSQPTRVIHARNPNARTVIEECLLEAAYTVLHRTLPVLADEGSVRELWVAALELSYGTELRTERRGRAAELVGHDGEFYDALTRQLADSLCFGFTVYDEDGEVRYRSHASPAQRAVCRFQWRVRRVQGKLLSVLRLVKALFTFEGGLDYIAWKLERHSGEHIEIPDNVRRFPLLFMWPFFWRLYRRGIFK